SHLALPDRKISQVNQKSDRLVIFIGLPLQDVRCNLVPSRFFALLQLVQIASAVCLVLRFPARRFCCSLRLQSPFPFFCSGMGKCQEITGSARPHFVGFGSLPSVVILVEAHLKLCS